MARVVVAAVSIAATARDTSKFLSITDLVGRTVTVATATSDTLATATDLTSITVRVLCTFNADIALALTVVGAVGCGQTLHAFLGGGVTELTYC